FSVLVTEREILRALGELPREYLWLALLLGIVPWFTNALRLLIWTRFLGHGVRFREAFEITLATDLGAAVSPTAVGGGFFKWGLLVQRGVSPGAAASLTTLTPIEDGLFFAIALPVAIFITASWDHPVFVRVAGEFRESAPLVILIALAIAVVSWAAVRFVLGGGLGPRTQRRSLRVALRFRRSLRATSVDALQVFRMIRVDGKARFALSMSLTAVQWTCRYSIISALIAFLGAPVQPVLFWLLQWVVFTLAAFIPTPGAAGGAEAAFFVIYSPFLPGTLVALATAGWRFLTFYLLLGLAGVLYIVLGGLHRRTPNAGS
ncbi:MAG TPA: flippase-like domain-containing protein, partial [Longimicrobiaceae bacterium]|nr:flippase-like domain-containing protein [Longimicrobiaceae bacterium]